MIAIVNILNSKGEVINKQIGIELGRGERENLIKKIPKEFRFVCWNEDYTGKDLLVDKEFEEKVEKIVEQQAVERADSSNDYVFVNGKMIKRESNTTDSKTEK